MKTRMTYPVTSLWPGRAGLRRADHIFCLNSDDRRYLQERLGRAPDSVTRIFPGADFAYARAPRIYDDVRQMLFAAAWRDNKGIADLVPAFVALAERHPALTLAVVGAGVPDATVRQRFPEALRHRVMCQTPSDEAGTVAAFAAADVFLLPSLFEGTPLTLIQAMMSGLPIVTTSTCGMKDVITDERSGLLMPIRSPHAMVGAVERLIAERGLRERLGRAARDEAMAHYSWDQAATPVEQAYLRLSHSLR